MNEATVKLKLLSDDVNVPEYKTEDAAGFDIAAVVEEACHFVVLKPMERYIFSTKLSVEIPKGYELQIRPRSGLAIKQGLTVINSPATIDADYRGEIKVCIINLSDEDQAITDGDRIAQGVLAPYTRAEFEITEVLSETERGEGGFGSTGKN